MGLFGTTDPLRKESIKNGNPDFKKPFIVWLHKKEKGKNTFCWVPHKIPIPPNLRRKFSRVKGLEKDKNNLMPKYNFYFIILLLYNHFLLKNVRIVFYEEYIYHYIFELYMCILFPKKKSVYFIKIIF